MLTNPLRECAPDYNRLKGAPKESKRQMPVLKQQVARKL